MTCHVSQSLSCKEFLVKLRLDLPHFISGDQGRPTMRACASVNAVQVKDWGSGEPADLGELQVESFSQELVSDHSKPFYEQLARRLEELQVNRCLILH